MDFFSFDQYFLVANFFELLGFDDLRRFLKIYLWLIKDQKKIIQNGYDKRNPVSDIQRLINDWSNFDTTTGNFGISHIDSDIIIIDSSIQNSVRLRVIDLNFVNDYIFSLDSSLSDVISYLLRNYELFYDIYLENIEIIYYELLDGIFYWFNGLVEKHQKTIQKIHQVYPDELSSNIELYYHNQSIYSCLIAPWLIQYLNKDDYHDLIRKLVTMNNFDSEKITKIFGSETCLKVVEIRKMIENINQK